MKLRKYIHLVLLIFFSTGLCFSQVSEGSGTDPKSIPGNNESCKISNDSNCNIGITDSVIFNLSSAYQLASLIDIPIFIRSASLIYSVDFSIRYNEQKVLLDTLIVLDSNLQYLYYYNFQDSTLRFTSNSLTSIPNDSTIVILRFEVLSSPMCTNDIQNVNTLLNGDWCSYYVSNCVISGTPEFIVDKKPQVYPNPTTDFLKILTATDGTFQLFNIEGNSVTCLLKMNAGTMSTLNTALFPPGIYIYRFQSDTIIFTGKVVINK